jgi:hypothetical protein
MQKIPYIKHWAAKDDVNQNNIINQKASSGFWKSPTTWKTKKRLLQCKTDTLLTQHLKRRYKLQPEPYCPMRKAKNTLVFGTVTHRKQATQNDARMAVPAQRPPHPFTHRKPAHKPDLVMLWEDGMVLKH